MTTTAHEDQYAPEPVSGDPVFESRAMVADADIDALVAKGWDWHAAYRHLQTVAHQTAHLHLREGEG